MCEKVAGEPVRDTKSLHLCFECVEDEYLRAEIEKGGDDGVCSYCEREGKTFSIDQIAGPAETALSELFYCTEKEPQDDIGVPTKGKWRRKGRPVANVVSVYGEIPEAAAEDVRRVLAERHNAEWGDLGLDESPFDPEAHYAKRDSVDAWNYEGDWRDFEKSLKTETRYFNRSAEAVLTSVFEGIDGHNTMNGRPIVAEAGPGTELAVLYRARVFQSEAEIRKAMKRPDKEIGPWGAVAGRMNAAGIAVFYGATDPGVALAEVQPPVGSKVLIGRFEVIRPLRFLDLEALEFVANENGSVFDPGYLQRMKRAEFLRGMSRRIAKPVMPNDQPRDYLPTQAIADFLATAGGPSLDGIIYPSVQAGHLRSRRPTFGRGPLGSGLCKRNVVLFQKAARVQALDEGAAISVSDDSCYWTRLLGDSSDEDTFSVRPLCDQADAKYTVVVKVPNIALAPEPDDAPLRFLSLEVHFVDGVTFNTRSSQVARHELYADILTDVTNRPEMILKSREN